jgi:hypothetical protein
MLMLAADHQEWITAEGTKEIEREVIVCYLKLKTKKV